MRIAIGGDSAGDSLATILAAHLGKNEGWTVDDISKPDNGEAELYPSLAERAAQAVLADRYDRAILCCGTGIGVCISANKIPGIRAAHTHDTYSAERAALSNDAHIITMGARVIGPELAKAIADAFLRCRFDPNSASARNVAAMEALDRKYNADR